MIKGILIGLAIMWALLVSFIALTAILASYKNDKELEAIKSWCPYCKIRIPTDEDINP